jgi:hypothetical protein
MAVATQRRQSGCNYDNESLGLYVMLWLLLHNDVSVVIMITNPLVCVLCYGGCISLSDVFSKVDKKTLTKVGGKSNTA